MITPIFSIETKKQAAMEAVMQEVADIACDNAHKQPKMTTLVEEFAKAVLAARGKHDDPLRLELVQIASVCLNLLWKIDLNGEDSIKNLHTKY